jgi:hypothetical protein
MRKKIGTTKTCAYCKKEFYVQKSRADNAKYCSNTCHYADAKGKPSKKDKRVEINCKTCGKKFKIPTHRINQAKFCSRKCRRLRLSKICKYCRKPFEVIPSRNNAVFCSRKCQDSNLIGKPSPLKKKYRVKCQECGGYFEVIKARLNKVKFCSLKCKNQRVDVICNLCRKTFLVKRSHANRTKYCSRKCFSQGVKGRVPWNKGGRMPEEQRVKRCRTLQQMQEYAKSKGGNCLSKRYMNNHTSLKWICLEGHEWKARPANILSGTWCPQCRNDKLSKKFRGDINEYKRIAKERGGELLTKSFINSRTRMQWKCKEGHTWWATAASIKSKNSWCPECFGNIKLTLYYLKELAKKRGGLCLSTEYVNAQSPMEWSCEQGHVWTATAGGIVSGKWCPSCKVRVSERICRKYFEEIFKEKFLKIRPDWLRNDRGRKMELDGYSKKLNLAFEYQGEQHYFNIPNLQVSHPLERIIRDDILKEKLCKENNVRLIHVPYYVRKEDMGKYILQQVDRYGITVPETTYVHDYKKFDIYSSKRLDEMKEIAKGKGGECLSEVYINAHIPLKWRCAKGHEWEAPAQRVKNKDSWCLKCTAMTRSEARKLNLETLQTMANAHEGECLSTKYINSKAKYLWRCKEGHTWETCAEVVRTGSWCPYCSGNRKIVDKEQARLIA